MKEYPAGLECGRCGMSCTEVYVRAFQGEDVACKVRESGGMSVRLDGEELQMMPFVGKVLAGTVKGFLRQLKGYRDGEIKIVISNSNKEEK